MREHFGRAKAAWRSASRRSPRCDGICLHSFQYAAAWLEVAQFASSFQPALPPAARLLRQLGDGLGQALGNDRRDLGLRGVVAQEFLGAGELPGGGLLRVGKLLLFLRAMLGFLFHTASGGFGKVNGKGFAGAMQLAADSIGRLLGERGDFVVT